MRLIYYPNPILLKKCKEISNSGEGQSKDDRIRLATKMWNIMRKKRGVGLSAPQVGLDIRMFVWSHNNQDQAIWNPKLICVSGCIDSVEGCLSLPNISVTLKRATSSILIGTGLNGKPFQFIGDENTTRIWQHEIDHLDGKLIIDNMNRDDELRNKDALRFLLNTIK